MARLSRGLEGNSSPAGLEDGKAAGRVEFERKIYTPEKADGVEQNGSEEGAEPGRG